MNADILFVECDISFKLRKVIVDNFGCVRKIDNTTVIAINHKSGVNQFVDKYGIHKIYRLADENLIEVIYKHDSDSFAHAVIIV